MEEHAKPVASQPGATGKGSSRSEHLKKAFAKARKRSHRQYLNVAGAFFMGEQRMQTDLRARRNSGPKLSQRND